MCLFAHCARSSSPESFPSDALTPISGNYVLAASNIRKLLKLIDAYYRRVLHRTVDTSIIDSTALSKGDELQAKALVQLVVGCAALCEDRGVFVPRILSLDAKSQEVLKTMIEAVMTSTSVIDESDTSDVEGEEKRRRSSSVDNDATLLRAGRGDADEELFRARQMIEHLTSEKEQLVAVIASMEQERDAQAAEHEERKQQLRQLQIQLDEQQVALKYVGRQRKAAAVPRSCD